MRGHSTTAPLPRTPHHVGLSAPSAMPERAAPSAPARAVRALWVGGSARLVTVGLGALLTLAGCGSGYGPYGPYSFGNTQPGGPGGEGRLAIGWTLNDAALTPERCQTERIDSMSVQVVSEIDGISSVEFVNVVCSLSRYSMEHVPSGPVSVYVNAVHSLSSQRECVRYAAIAHTTATAQYAATPFPIKLLSVNNCP